METQYAGFWRRLAANLIDALILGTLAIILWIAVVYACANGNGNAAEEYLTHSWDPILIGLDLLMVGWAILGFIYANVWPPLMSVLLLNWLYHALMESSAKQATPGKMTLKIRVTDLN